MEAELRAMLTQTVTVHPAGVPDDYGRLTRGADVALPCHITYRVQEVAVQGGQTALAEGWLYADVDATIGHDDTVTLPLGGTAPVIAVQPVYDEVGLHHYKVFFGSAV